MDGGGDTNVRSSKRESRRISKAAPVDDYFDPRNGNQNSATTPYLGSGGDKTSSWVESVNREPPMPLAPEDTATVIEPAPEEEAEHGVESEEDIRRRMHGRRERRKERESYRDSGDVRDREDRDRDERKRERRRRERDQQGEKISDPSNDKERRRRSSYYPEPAYPYPEYATAERPQAAKRTSWLKKIPINQLF
jgi:hypothetical protein